jgi:hypothetical protein
MTRFLYGGGGDGDIIKPSGVPYINANASVYNARTGGTQVTDLQNAAGSSITSITTDSSGQALFYGPDNYIGVLWLDFGSGIRWALSPKAVDLAATRAIAVQRAADAAAAGHTTKAALPYSANDPLEQALTTALDPLVIPRFASQSARDASFPSPVNGDRCYRTDLALEQIYHGPLGLWRNMYPYGYGSSGGSTGITWTTTETQLALASVPGGYAQSGATFRLTAYGTLVQAPDTTPDFSFRLRIGGLSGASLASNQFTAATNSSPIPRSWSLQANVTVVSSGSSGTWFGNLTSQSTITSTGPLYSSGASLRSDGTSTVTRDTTTNQNIALTGQWGTSSPLNSCVLYGWYFERVC